MKKYILLITVVLFTFITTSCATTITTRMVMQKYPGEIQKKETLDAISFVLSNNGFDIAMMNENYGLVSTNYRKIVSGTDTALSVLSILSAAMSKTSTSYSTYEREVMISIQLDGNGFKVIPKVRRISNTRSTFSTSSQDNIEYPTQDSSEGQLIDKIIKEINALLKINDDYIWAEKIISIEEQ